MSRDDCPVCQQPGPHYVPQGCIRNLLVKVAELAARVDALQEMTIDTFARSPAIVIGKSTPVPTSTPDHIIGEGPSLSVTLEASPQSYRVPAKSAQSERMTKYWGRQEGCEVTLQEMNRAIMEQIAKDLGETVSGVTPTERCAFIAGMQAVSKSLQEAITQATREAYLG